MNPLSFSRIEGQDRAILALVGASARKKLHHGLLFVGPDGVGKRQVARALAASTFCASPQPLQLDPSLREACGSCGPCRRMLAGTHPDFVEQSPDGRNYKIEQVRETISVTKYRPAEAGARFIILDAVDLLRDEAANALLKTLEEPTGETHFILLTAQPHRLLSTIRSRCLRVAFAPLADSVVAKVLVAAGVDATAAAGAARLSGGSITRANAVRETSAYANRDEIARAITTLDEASMAELIALAEAWTKDKEAVRPMLDLVRALVRDAMVLRAGLPERRLHLDLAPLIDPWSAGRPLQAWLGVIDQIEQAERELLGNVNPRMVVENLMLALRRDSV